MKYVINQKTKERLETQHAQVQESISKLPKEQQQTVKGIQALVDYEIDRANELFFGDEMFRVDEFLIKHGISGNHREHLMEAIERTPLGGIFVLNGKCFIKTYNNLVFSTVDYIRSLEMTIADQVQYGEVPYKIYKYSFLDIIKYAFKTLLKKEQ